MPQRGLYSAFSFPTLSTCQRPKTLTIECTSNPSRFFNSRIYNAADKACIDQNSSTCQCPKTLTIESTSDSIKAIKKTERNRHRFFSVLPQRGLHSTASFPTLFTCQRPKTLTIEFTSNATTFFNSRIHNGTDKACTDQNPSTCQRPKTLTIVFTSDSIKVIKKTERNRHRFFGVLPQRGLHSAASFPTLSTCQSPKTLTIEFTSNATTFFNSRIYNGADKACTDQNASLINSSPLSGIFPPMI